MRLKKSSVKLKRKGSITVIAKGLDDSYMDAFVGIADMACRGYSKVFGLGFPAQVFIVAERDPKNPNMLNTDGTKTVYFTFRGDKDLLSPRESGFLHIFGISHELGHIAFSRSFAEGFTLKDDMAGAVYQAWADYSAAKRIIPFIHGSCNYCPWPHPYDFLAEEGPRHLSAFLRAKGIAPWTKTYIKLFDAVDKTKGPRELGKLVKKYGRELMSDPENFVDRLKKLAKR
ncbi:MAG: hypothetical protein WC369_02835 [Dehalococcoidales bacterium]|jgi:hypothetical protein